MSGGDQDNIAAAAKAGDIIKEEAIDKVFDNNNDTPTSTSSPSNSPPAPNSTLREETDPDEDTYVYRDFATLPPPNVGAPGANALHPQSLQAQKLPAKLASMLSDPALSTVILWMPHGRSWRVLNRDLFAEHALPSYFGHKNYASFVRIVNAWGFRRITRGADRDSYYHELFLRGRPDLHQRMKRLSTCHRKTPVHKEDKCPDFYELAKMSPLPEVPLTRGGSAGSALAAAGQMPGISPHASGLSGQAAAAMGSMGGGNQMQQVLSSLLAGNNAASRPPNQIAALQNHASLPRLAQLQRDNEDLRRRIMEMERMQQAAVQQGGGMMNQQREMGSQQMIPDQFASLSANIAGTMNASAPGGGNNVLERELERMQRGFMMQSNPAMNNSAVNANNLLSALSVGAAGGGASGNAAAAGNPSEFSFMTNFPRDQMLLRAMRLENQIGSSSSSNVSPLDFALQQNNNIMAGGPAPSAAAPASAGMTAAQAEGNRAKAMMDWMVKQQQQQGQGSL